MTLNEIFRRTGEPTYHTPIAVIGELVKAAQYIQNIQMRAKIMKKK